jgi:hypothetical protein
MDYVDLEKNVSIIQIFSTVVQKRVTSISRTLVGLGRMSSAISSRPPVHCGATIKRAILGSSMNKNTNVGPPQSSGNPTTGRQSSKGSHCQ